MSRRRALPAWADWRGAAVPYTLGVEEEVMLLDPSDWSLAQDAERVLASLEPPLAGQVSGETHRCALELQTGVHRTVASAADELRELRARFGEELRAHGLRAASAGTHPSASWRETTVSTSPRYRLLYGSLRELARREPTFGLHVHVGVPNPEEATALGNRLRAHVPLLLALSANSPFWQGRDTGLRSARTPIFQAFPRTGMPRAFADYADWADAVDVLIRCEAIPEHTFLWWDVRLQPRLGTVELRMADAQGAVADTAALVALVQSVARLELEEGYAAQRTVESPEVLAENRFLAARDGMDARLIDPVSERLVPARQQLAELLSACAPHARALGCAVELESARLLAERPGAERQLELARRGLDALVESLADDFRADAMSLNGAERARAAR